jgi:transcriptional antiterminator NusG
MDTEIETEVEEMILNDDTEQTTEEVATEPTINEIPPELNTAGNSRMDKNARWYALHTFNGYEAVAEDNLKKVIEKYELEERVLETFIPTEDVMVEKKDGSRVIVSQKSMPSYIFVKMIYGDDIWHTVTRTRGITGFVGPKGRPLPLTENEVMKMKLERKANVKLKLEKDDVVQIIDGPLMGQTATVVGTDPANHKVTVIVVMLGRSNKIDLHTSQVKRV